MGSVKDLRLDARQRAGGVENGRLSLGTTGIAWPRVIRGKPRVREAARADV